jgi:hypothetical protein
VATLNYADSRNPRKLVRERVRRGARFLDRTKPGWLWQIKEDELDFLKQDNTLLGLLVGSDYSDFADIWGDSKWNEIRYYYGFELPPYSPTYLYAELKRVWIGHIARRKYLHHNGEKFKVDELIALVGYKGDTQVRVGWLRYFDKTHIQIEDLTRGPRKYILASVGRIQHAKGATADE